MAGIYRQRHPEKTVLYRVLFHFFEGFLFEYEQRFEREYGYFRPVVKEVFLCHHEARRAVVISLFIALNWMRLPRFTRNDVWTAAIRRIALPGFGAEIAGKSFYCIFPGARCLTSTAKAEQKRSSRTPSSSPSPPAGTSDGSRREWKVLLKASIAAFCRFERWSLS